MQSSTPHTPDVLKPVGHVMVSFPQATQAQIAARALRAMGLRDDGVHPFSDYGMLAQIDNDLHQAGESQRVNGERDRIRLNQNLSESGHHWLVVEAADSETACRVAQCVWRLGADHARHYGSAAVKELIQS